MTDLSNATPRPWHKSAYSSVVGLPIMAQPNKFANSKVIVSVRGEWTEAEANAALIVAAVNSYDAHLKCVEAAQKLRDHQIAGPDRDCWVGDEPEDEAEKSSSDWAWHGFLEEEKSLIDALDDRLAALASLPTEGE